MELPRIDRPTAPSRRGDLNDFFDLQETRIPLENFHPPAHAHETIQPAFSRRIERRRIDTAKIRHTAVAYSSQIKPAQIEVDGADLTLQLHGLVA